MKANTAAEPKRLRTSKKPEGHSPEQAQPTSSYDAIMKLIAHAGQIPDEVWADFPADSSKQVDHYLYGSPKVPD